ncbi:hypothetical protein [Marinoscillum sp. MHG1-6]|uniref:hypothetical protein n=1 Tax=Marinoscillum sp. MHG1-6 TaxID=2959627 RepID=UPI002158641F|nr:hypothetical protein [Marinoscillum sp. MHG1-6]
MKNLYLERYAWPTRVFPDFSPTTSPDLIVVIPVYHEPNLMKALESLNKCSDNEDVLVIAIINESENEDSGLAQVNQKTLQNIEGAEFQFQFLFKLVKLPPKKAGVGLARKIGMDEAVRIFEEQEKDGIIVCYDADCTCETNYLSAIKEYYTQTYLVGLIHYEHTLNGENLDAIVDYELYLRYYVNALRWADFPFAFQTLGSCITVKSRAYQKQGGMNTRKAGEDFYFIHKMTPLGRMGEINNTAIYPSDRVSDRVPFGTGQAVEKYLKNEDSNYEVYNPRVFIELKHFIEAAAYLYDCTTSYEMILSEKCQKFVDENDFETAFQKMKKNSPNAERLQKRFFEWFDGFRALKFVHFMRDRYYPNIDIIDALEWLQHEYLKIPHFKGSKETKLMALREHDRSQDFYLS